MKDIVNKLPLYILVLILSGAIAYVLFRKAPDGTGQQTVTVKLSYDSLPKIINHSTIENPVVIKPGAMNIPPAIIQLIKQDDSAAISKILFEVLNRYYEDRVQHSVTADTNLIVETWDSITENAIYGRKLQYKWLKPVEVKTIIVPERVKLYAGIGMEAGMNGMYSISPELYLALRKGTMIGIGYNTYSLATGKDKYAFRFSVAQKISFRKKKE